MRNEPRSNPVGRIAKEAVLLVYSTNWLNLADKTAAVLRSRFSLRVSVPLLGEQA